MIKKPTKKPSVKKPSTAKVTKPTKSLGAKKSVATKKPAPSKRQPAAKKSTAVKSVKKTTTTAKKTVVAKKSTAPAKRPLAKKTAAVKPAAKKATTKASAKRTTPARTKTTKTTKATKAKSTESIKSSVTPLIIEPYPKDYTGLPFLTLIQFRRQPMLVIVDNVDDDLIRAYVLDLCGPAHVDEEKIVLAAAEWFSESRSKYPISIEFSKRGMTTEASKIYRTFDIEFVSRVIGPAPEFPMGATKSVRRRRRKPVPPGVEVVRNTSDAVDSFFTS